MAFTKAQLTKNLERIRAIALALPEATEELTWGDHVNFRVRNKMFCLPGEGDRLTVKADPEERVALLGDPRVTPAPYLAKGGWVRVHLAAPIDWEEVRELVTTSYCLIAPKSLSKLVD
jgi:predicted DNA-binding protein (MmcQ/YjbR family)